MATVRLLVHCPYYRPHVGGLETYVEELADALWSLGGVDAITVLAPSLPDGAPAREMEPAGTRIIRYPGREVIANFPVPKLLSRGWRRALRDAALPRPDVVVGHTRFFATTAIALAHARALGVPYVHVEHGSDFVQLDAWWTSAAARIYDGTLGRLVLRRADVRLAVSAAAAGFVRQLAGVDADVVYRGLPLARLEAASPPPAAVRFADGRPLVVYVGRLIDGKGVGDLVEAVAGMREDARCVVVGDGPRGPELRRRAEETSPGRWRFTGYLPEDDALSWVQAADIVVNPSYTEGLPTTVLWGAALGRAIVATDVGGTREIVEHGVSGVLVAPRAPDELRLALDALAADPARRERLGSAARAGAHDSFDAVTGARRWLELATAAPARTRRSRRPWNRAGRW